MDDDDYHPSAAASSASAAKFPTSLLSTSVDLEQGGSTAADAHLLNTTVSSIAWRGVTVTVRDRKTKEPRNLVENVEGYVEAGKF
ncbi:hypothetical protein PG995_002796 [Apiospora arundinis]